MPEYTVTFDVPDDRTMLMPGAELSGGHYELKADSDGNIDISGDRQGLLYLAEVIVRAAIGGYEPGFHVHLPARGVGTGPNVNGEPEVIVYSADTDMSRSA